MKQKSKLKTAAYKTISHYYGERVAQHYADFYADIPDEKVLVLVAELLEEYLGEEKANQQFEKLKQNL